MIRRIANLYQSHPASFQSSYALYVSDGVSNSHGGEKMVDGMIISIVAGIYFRAIPFGSSDICEFLGEISLNSRLVFAHCSTTSVIISHITNSIDCDSIGSQHFREFGSRIKNAY